MGTATNHPESDRVKPYVICHFLTSGHSNAQPWASECPDVKNWQMTYGLTRSGTGWFIAVPIWQQWASKGYHHNVFHKFRLHLFCTWHSQCSTVFHRQSVIHTNIRSVRTVVTTALFANVHVRCKVPFQASLELFIWLTIPRSSRIFRSDFHCFIFR